MVDDDCLLARFGLCRSILNTRPDEVGPLHELPIPDSSAAVPPRAVFLEERSITKFCALHRTAISNCKFLHFPAHISFSVAQPGSASDFRSGASLRQALIRSRFSSNDECGRHAGGEDARRRGHHAAHRQQEICQVLSRVACHVYDFRSGVRPRQAPPSPCMGDFVPPCGVFSQQLY